MRAQLGGSLHTNLNVVEETIVGSTNLNVVEETIVGGTTLIN